MRSAFLTTLDERPLLCDGAMGTLLHERGVPADACLEAVALEEPSLLLQVHSDYIEAGADIIETNTFGANSVRLGHFGLADRLREINRLAVEIAQRATSQTTRPVYVAGAMGPLDVGLPGGESMTLKKAHLVFHEQAEALIEAGVDLIAIETFPTLAEAKEALQAVRECGDLPVMVAANVPARRPHLGRRRAGRGGSCPARPGREHRRRQLRARAAVRARHHQAACRRQTGEAFRATERRPAAGASAGDCLSRDAAIVRGVRAALHRSRGVDRRRLLRYDA